MVEFRIDANAIELNADANITFTWENNAFKLNTYSFGRSVSFSIPKTPHNERILQDESNIFFGGSFSRSNTPCQMLYSGGAVDGKIIIGGYSGNAYSACFIFENDEIKSFLESKIAEYIPIIQGSQASTGNEKNTVVEHGFLLYKSKQNGIASLDATYAPEVRMLHSIKGLYIFQKLNIGYDNTVAGWQFPFENDYLMSGDLKPYPSGTYTGALGGQTIPPTLATYVELTTDTGSVVRTARIGGFPKHAINGSVTLPHCYLANADISIKFTQNYPNGVLLVERDGIWLHCGTNEKSVVVMEKAGYVVWRAYHIRIVAGNEFLIKSGERFVIVNGDYFNDDYGFLQTTKLDDFDMQDTNLTDVIVTYTADDKLNYGEYVDLARSVPDMTVYQFINIFSLVNGRTPIFSNAGSTGRYVEFWDWKKNENTAIVLDTLLISVSKIERKIDPLKTHNNFTFGEKTEASYVSKNTTLGDFDVISTKIRLSEANGDFDDYPDEKFTNETFIGGRVFGQPVVLGRKNIAINQNLKKIVEESTVVEVIINYPLFRSLKIKEKTLFLLHGQTYFCLSANFSEKVATLQLILC